MTTFLIVGIDDDEEPILTKDGLIAHYNQWNQSGRSTPVTEYHLAGLFYLRYRERFKVDSPSHVMTDLEHFRKFFHVFKAAPDMALNGVEVFFTLKGFNGLHPRKLSNPNVIAGWDIVERANKFQRVQGEQSEFKKSESYGVKYL